MRNLPTIRTKMLTKQQGDRYAHRLDVTGGLEHLRGNARPHFSLTCWEYAPHNRNVECSGGCAHGLILRHWPELADLAALHLSDDDGVPMHAEGNGWYWLSGYFGGLADEYHGGNSQRQHWKNADGTPADDSTAPGVTFDGYRESTPDECLATFANLVRLSIDDARALAHRIAADFNVGELRNLSRSNDPNAVLLKRDIRDTLRMLWKAECDAMRPRWKAEAEACIAKHNLVTVKS